MTWQLDEEAGRLVYKPDPRYIITRWWIRDGKRYRGMKTGKGFADIIWTPDLDEAKQAVMRYAEK